MRTRRSVVLMTQGELVLPARDLGGDRRGVLERGCGLGGPRGDRSLLRLERSPGGAGR
jgi:hypothetical protein